MASEADFSDLLVMERAVEITFRPTGERLSFARFGALLSPGRPISPPNFGLHPSWEVEWLARNLAQQALLRFGRSAPRAAHPAHQRANRAAPRPPPSADQPTHVRLQHDLARAIERNRAVVALPADLRRARRGRSSGRRRCCAGPIRCCGAIAPAEFIPLAEGSGEISAIGRWVLDHAMAEAATWEQPWRVAVNLSPVQFRQADLVETVRANLVRYKLPGDRLELEITEGVLIDDTSRALTVLRTLKQLGVSIALDDFGTGYSNLTYLRVLPIDRIKIDKSFVQDLGTSSQSDAIVRTIIAMGQALGLEVTAEGVETEAQLDFPAGAWLRAGAGLPARPTERRSAVPALTPAGTPSTSPALRGRSEREATRVRVVRHQDPHPRRFAPRPLPHARERYAASPLIPNIPERTLLQPPVLAGQQGGPARGGAFRLAHRHPLPQPFDNKARRRREIERQRHLEIDEAQVLQLARIPPGCRRRARHPPPGSGR